MRYSIKAMQGDAVIDLHLDAADEAAARDEASRRGYAVLSVRGRNQPFRSLELRRSFPVALFSMQLVALLDAGLNLVEAMHALAAKEGDASRRRVLDGVLDALAAGESFSGALERFPEQFPRVYVAVVRASERTGDLRRALARYVEYETRFQQVRKKVVSALLYPCILVVVGCAVLAFLMFYVVPRFGRIYDDAAASLPFFSGILLHAGSWMERHAALVSSSVFGATLLVAWAAARPRTRARCVQLLWHVPQVGEHMRLYQLARLYGTLGMLLKSGVPIVAAMRMAAGLSSHLDIQLERARAAVQGGGSISAAMAASGLSTSIADQLLAVGERTGQMGEMMERVAAFHDDDLARWLDWSMRVLEPVLMAVIGVAVGVVVVLMYMPVFELAGSLQ